MRTEAQIQASRINGAKSRGPVTAEGKRTSSRNAETHGLLANTLVLKTESRASFLELLTDLLEEHQPQTPTEYALVEMMVAARWRQRRIWGMETAGLDHEICRVDDACTTAEYNASDHVTSAAKAFRALADDSRTLDLYSRYDARYERQFLRAERRLLELIDRRNAPAPSGSPQNGTDAPAPPCPIDEYAESCPVATETDAPDPEPLLTATFTEADARPQPEKTVFTKRTQAAPAPKRQSRRQRRLARLASLQNSPRRPEMAFAAGACGTSAGLAGKTSCAAQAEHITVDELVRDAVLSRVNTQGMA